MDEALQGRVTSEQTSAYIRQITQSKGFGNVVITSQNWKPSKGLPEADERWQLSNYGRIPDSNTFQVKMSFSNNNDMMAVAIGEQWISHGYSHDNCVTRADDGVHVVPHKVTTTILQLTSAIPVWLIISTAN
jgi:hypothetical protein